LILNRKQKAALVIKLANEGKTTREIAKEVRISLKDIGEIMRKYTGDGIDDQQLVKKPTVESQAFKLFKEGKNNVDVAISLNLSAREVILFYHDFLEMSDLNKLYDLHYALGENLRFFIELYERMKNEGLLTIKDISNVARTQAKIRNLDLTINGLYEEISKLNLIRMDLRDKIKELADFKTQYISCRT
jgi:hypothetical protein